MPPRETELKLDVAPSALLNLSRSVALKGLKGQNGYSRPRSKNLVSVYFDTDDFKLRKAGFTLRVRRDGRRHLQTIKQEGEHAALLSRNEWEQPIRGDHPDLEAARNTGLGPLLTKKLARQLKPMFETAVRRTIYPVRDGLTEIELTLDEGKVVAGGKSQPFHEVELELKSGAPVDLFKLARTLGQDVPVQLSLRTKSERGYALLDGKEPAPVKAPPIPLAPDYTAEAALQAIAQTCLYQLVANQPLIRIGEPEGLHQTRVALRRLRVALSLFSPLLADTQSQELKSQLRWLNGELNPARELDVFIQRVLKLMEDEGRQDRPGLAALLKDLRHQRAQAYARIRTALNSFRFRDLILNTAAWIEVGDWTRNGDDVVRALRERSIVDTAIDELQRRCKKIYKHGKHLRKLSPHKRHKLRIQTKKVRYASDFFAAAFPGKKGERRRKAFIGALAKLQDTLGELNDISVHGDLTVGLAQNGNGTANSLRPRKAFAAGRLSGFEEARMATVLRDAERAYETFARVKPFWP